MLTIAQQAALFKCTEDQIRAQHAKNAVGIEQMIVKAQSTGKKVNGYTLEQLQHMRQKSISQSIA